ncbi:MAG TPA: UDP-N-acetylmuramoyl-L-alanyl-D-glutamate--2,6-diaminopimelate ligase [Chloroflexota bacterium]|nr:UDP-N-acetylmuramoyl-L-alanyl-D-glutamate--2,6-diaminopimelate ligase [Chloroflexota bacterium]
MPLSELLATAAIAGSARSNPAIVDISEDSREVAPGWVFVAIPGTAKDGARFVPDAVARGASAVLAETPISAGVPVIVVANARESLADCAAALHGFPSRRLPCFGITGTDGKTTTSFLLASILDYADMPAGLLTTVESRVGGHSVPLSGRLTTPGAAYLQRTLAQMVVAGDRAAVVECSSHGLALDRLRNVDLRAAAITNIAQDHIEFHGSHEEYARAKARIFELTVDGGSVLLNADDPVSMSLSTPPGRRVITFGLADTASLRASALSSSLAKTTFTIRWDGAEIDASIPLGGDFNVYNALAAVGLAISFGVPITDAAAGLARARTPVGRLQAIDVGQPFAVFVDYAHTVQAFTLLLPSLAEVAHRQNGRLIIVFGVGGDRDHAKRPALARLAAANTDYFVITTEDPYGEAASDIIAEIAVGAPTEEKERRWTTREDRRDGIECAIAHARPNDIVAILGKGHENKITTGEQHRPWSDEAACRELLAELGYAEPVGVGSG